MGRIFGSNFDFFLSCFDVAFVMIFYPPTNRDLYLVRGGGGGGGVFLALISLVYSPKERFL